MILFPLETTVRELSGEGNVVVEGGGGVVVVVMDESMDPVIVALGGEPVGELTVDPVAVDSDTLAVVGEDAIVLDDVVVFEEEESSISIADTPLHSSNASIQGIRHVSQASDSSSNSLFEERKNGVCEKMLCKPGNIDPVDSIDGRTMNSDNSQQSKSPPPQNKPNSPLKIPIPQNNLVYNPLENNIPHSIVSYNIAYCCHRSIYC